MPFKPKNSRFYHYDFQIRGCRFHGSCQTEDFQEAKAIEAEARVAAKSEKRQSASFTLSEAFGTYLATRADKSSHSVMQSHAKALLAHIRPKTYLEDITNSQVALAVSKMRATRANSTVNRRLETMSRAVNYMVKVHGATDPEIDWKLHKTTENNDRVRELSIAEQSALFETLRPDLVPLVKFALMTGKRKSEICNLKWSDINHETQRIHFRVKFGKVHRFPMSAEIRALLSSQPKSNVMRERMFVFTYLGVDGERYSINPTGGHIWKLWREALAGAEIYDFRFHDLRHTFATRMLRQTGNLKLVSRLLGHSDVQTTARYAHVLDDDMSEAMEAFSSLNPEQTPEVARKRQ